MSSAVSARPPGGQHRDPELTPTKDQPKTGALGLTSATGLVIGTVIGAGVFTMPAVLASAGTVSLLVLAVIAVGAMVLAILFGQLTRRVPNSDGGLYAYARYEFGDFAGYLIGGVLKADLKPLHTRSLKWEMLRADDFLLPPLPNHLFCRDNSAWAYGGVSMNPMAKPARQRENLHIRAVYNYHPMFLGTDFLTYYGDDDANHLPASVEGGDVHILGHGTVLIGMGERTTPMPGEILSRAL